MRILCDRNRLRALFALMLIFAVGTAGTAARAEQELTGTTVGPGDRAEESAGKTAEEGAEKSAGQESKIVQRQIAPGNITIDFKDAEKRVFKDQVKDLDGDVKKEMTALRGEYDAQRTKASLVARDADILECLLQAKEYYDSGYLKTKKFFKTAPDHLKTGSAKAFWKKIQKWDSSRWWEGIVKFER